MAIHVFPPFLAVDPTNPFLVVTNASGLVYASNDLTFTTPLDITDLNGGPVPNLTSNDIGLVAGFRVDCDGTAVWRSGSFAIPLMAPQAILDRALAAEQAAEQAAQGAVPAGGAMNQLLMKSSSADFAVQWGSPIVSIGPTEPWPTGLPDGTIVVRREV